MYKSDYKLLQSIHPQLAVIVVCPSSGSLVFRDLSAGFAYHLWRFLSLKKRQKQSDSSTHTLVAA
jgi:hypothetical protein